MPAGPMNPWWTSDGFSTEIINPTYLEAQAELGGKPVIYSNETHATRRLQVVLEA